MDIVKLGLENEVFIALKKYYPIIEEETSSVFEKEAQDMSSKKYVINAKYWLYRELGEYAENKKGL